MLRKIAAKIREILKKWDDILVVGHYDADGITATAITVETLNRMGKDVEFINVKQIYEDDAEKINDKGRNIVFVDLGAGQLEYLTKKISHPFVVIDHHVTAVPQYPFVFHPSLAGIDGSKEVSGAGMAYLLGEFEDLAKLAVVGATGDMQRMIGINKKILEHAVRSGDARKKKDLILYGRSSRPVRAMLEYSTSPILPGLTANRDACYNIIKRAGISGRDRYALLPREKKKNLFTELYIHLSRMGWTDIKIKKLVGTVIEFPGEEVGSPLYDVREFATMLNAAGRHGHADVGVQVCLGDRKKYLKKCMALMAMHRRILKKGIEWVLNGNIEELENVVFFHAEEKIPSEVVGIVAGMVYGSGVLGFSRPILGFAYEGGWVKVSARASEQITSKGVNLAELMKRSAEYVGGEAGGHKPAAGARIPRGKEEEFLRKFNEEVGKLL